MNDSSFPFRSFRSRLPDVGTTIFSTMSALAAQHQAVNLGQGFPDFECDPALLDAVDRAMREGHNQYPPMSGVPALRQAISKKIATLYGATYDAESEITITAGATQALLTAMLCCLHPGDEVIVIEPAFDSYLPAIALAGARAVTVPMHYDGSSFFVAWERVAAAVSQRTRLILINTPHNPTGSIFGDADMQSLAAIVAGTDILILSDEVYEHMVYDGAAHASVARYPDLAARSMLVGSFGKTFHVTGWKVGYVAAPAWLTAEFRKVHQFNVFTVNTPMQYALASYLANPHPYLALSSFYQAKR
ncbi:MAG: methionine aminotransferase, partial [Pseudomonadota bacterium]|nr:methionine aminotransferase [Pseudomonadota bacterium]